MRTEPTQTAIPVEGKIDQDGKVTVENPAAVLILSGCGETQTTTDVTFMEDKLNLKASTQTENCGTLIGTFVGTKT